MSRDPRDPTLETTVPPQRIADLKPGAVVGGHYRIEKELGRGAAGVVHAARHARTGALVALKVLPREGPGTSAARFDREVQALAKLQHPNIVSIHEAGETASFRWYSMDLVEGQRLDQHFKANPGGERAVKLLLEVARGIEHAHSRGLIHRDLKPSNILVTTDGIARVSDFGIAKHVDRATQLTQAGALVGTLHYMSPEQCADSAALDGRSDVWALGVMLFEAATGKLPFGGETTIAVISNICETALPRPRSLSSAIHPDLEAVIVRALEKDPAARYPTMAALAGDLERLLRGERVHARRVSTLGHLAKRLGPALTALLLVLVTALGVAGVLVALALLRSPGGHERTPGPASAAEVERLEQLSAQALTKGRAALATSPGEARLIALRALSERRRARLDSSPVAASLRTLAARATLALGDVRAARLLLEAPPPEDWDGLVALGEARLADGDVRGAEDILAAAAKLAPERKDRALATMLEIVRAEQLAALGKQTEALALLAAALKADSGHLGLKLARARLLVRTDDEAGALAELRSAGQREGLAIREEIRLHLASSACADATRALERLLRLAPNEPGPTIELATLLAALGEATTASTALHAALAQADAQGDALAAEVPRLLAALVPVEAALARDPSRLLARLEPLDPPLAALLRARTLGAEPAALEAAAGKAQGALRAALLAELGAALAPLDPSRARAHADEALRLDRGCRRARQVRALLDAKSGELVEARSQHEAARPLLEGPARLDAPELIALAEGRQDALVALDALNVVKRRVREEQRRPASGRLEGGTGDTTPSKELLERGARSLRYAIALDPGLTEARVLLGRLEAELGHAEQARVVAGEAVARDPLSIAAGALLARVAKPEDASSVIERTASALAAAPKAEAAPLREALSSLLERAGDLRRAALFAEDAALAGDRVDREVLAKAVDLLVRAGEGRSGELRARLEKEDQAVDAARLLGRQAEAASGKDRSKCAALSLRALHAEPDDLDVVSYCAGGFRRVHRSFVERTETQADDPSIDPTCDPLSESVHLALLDGRGVSEFVKHVYGLRSSYGEDLIDLWRKRSKDARGGLRSQLLLTLALVSATWDLYPQDKGAAYVTRLRRLPLADLHADLAELAATVPHVPSFYAARSIHFARNGQTASMRRDLDRLLGRRSPSPMDLWLAAATYVSIGDLESAENLALRSIRHPAADESTRNALLLDMPFATIKDSPSWAKVVAEIRK